MICAIFWIIIHCLTYFLVEYCNDGPKFSYSKVDDLEMPSVLDLDPSTDFYTINKYTKDVICPACRYFMLSKELRRSGDTVGPFSFFALQFSSIVMIFKRILGKIEMYEFVAAHERIFQVFVPIATIVFCALLSIPVGKFYKKSRFSIWECRENEQTISKYSLCREYKISEQKAVNHCLIECFNRYLLSIEKNVSDRIVASKFLSFFGIILFIIIFAYIRS